MPDLSTQIDQYLEARKIYHFENATGIRRFEALLKDVTGLDSHFHTSMLHAFFEDNPGAVEAVINWMRERNAPEWIENLKALGCQGEEDIDAEDENPEAGGG